MPLYINVYIQKRIRLPNSQTVKKCLIPHTTVIDRASENLPPRQTAPMPQLLADLQRSPPNTHRTAGAQTATTAKPLHLGTTHQPTHISYHIISYHPVPYIPKLWIGLKRLQLVRFLTSTSILRKAFSGSCRTLCVSGTIVLCVRGTLSYYYVGLFKPVLMAFIMFTVVSVR